MSSIYRRRVASLVEASVTVKLIAVTISILPFIASFMPISELFGNKEGNNFIVGLVITSVPFLVITVWMISNLYREIHIPPFPKPKNDRRKSHLLIDTGLKLSYPNKKWVELRFYQCFFAVSVLWLLITISVFSDNHPLMKIFSLVISLMEIVCNIIPFC